MKKYTLDQVKDQFIGPEGSPKRIQYEMELKMNIIGDLIKSVRKERNLTQTELGQLIGVQKAQISKLENNTKNVTIGTFLKVFEGLKAKIWLKIEIPDKDLEII